jgi:hypothetical protein
MSEFKSPTAADKPKRRRSDRKAEQLDDDETIDIAEDGKSESKGDEGSESEESEEKEEAKA